MHRLFDWVIDNKHWVFSGAGVFLLGALAAAGRTIYRKLFSEKPDPEQISQPDQASTSFNPEDIVVEFDDAPYLLLNFENHILSFSVRTTIRNFSPHDIRVSWGQCKPIIDSFGLIDLEQSKQLPLPSGARGQYVFEKSLTDGEVRRALKLLDGASERLLRIQFHLLVGTPFGDRDIHLPSKATSIVLCQVGQYRNTKEYMENDFTIHDFKIAILKEIATEAQKPVHKYNLLGRPPSHGPLERRLGITYTSEQRARAVRAFDELKAADLIRPTYSDPVDPENWVDITEAGHEALRTGSFQAPTVAGTGKFGVQDALLFLDKAKQAAETSHFVSALFLDLDNFKSVNDTYDHSTGDQVIREAIAIIQQVIQGKGELFHRSGDEMIVLLPNFDEDEAHTAAERICRSIESNTFSIVGQGVITATIGASTYPHTCLQLSELEVTSDKAAMEAKKRGKNIVLSVQSRDQPTSSSTANKPRLPHSARALLVILSEELVGNLKSVTGVTYEQLGGLIDDQYRRICGDPIFSELPNTTRSLLSDAYQAVKNVNDSIKRVSENYTPAGIDSRNKVLQAKQQSLQPLQMAVEGLRQYLAESEQK